MDDKLFSTQLQAAIAAQEELQPSPAVKARLMAKIHQPAQPWLKPALRWVMGAAVALLAALVLWAAVQPGTVETSTIQTDLATKREVTNKLMTDILAIPKENDPAVIEFTNMTATSTRNTLKLVALIIVGLTPIGVLFFALHQKPNNYIQMDFQTPKTMVH